MGGTSECLWCCVFLLCPTPRRSKGFVLSRFLIRSRAASETCPSPPLLLVTATLSNGNRLRVGWLAVRFFKMFDICVSQTHTVGTNPAGAWSTERETERRRHKHQQRQRQRGRVRERQQQKQKQKQRERERESLQRGADTRSCRTTPHTH